MLDALAAVAPPSTPIVCLQNGVANEVAFLRRFANVHGVTVMAPTWHLEPGVVRAYTHEAAAILDVGRWPGGVDDVDRGAWRRRSVRPASSRVARPDIPRWKYAKLLLNLGNPVDALCPRDDATSASWPSCARDEGEAVLEAAGIDHVTRRRGPAPGAATSCGSSRSTTRPGPARRRGRAWPAACPSRSTT